MLKALQGPSPGAGGLGAPGSTSEDPWVSGGASRAGGRGSGGAPALHLEERFLRSKILIIDLEMVEDGWLGDFFLRDTKSDVLLLEGGRVKM